MQLEKIFEKYGITEYWLIKHNIKVSEFTLSYGIKEVNGTEEYINDLYYIYDNGLYNLSFGIIDEDQLELLIKKNTDNKEFHIFSPSYKNVYLIEQKNEKNSDECDYISIIESEMEKHKKVNTYIKYKLINDDICLFQNSHEIVKRCNKSFLEIMDMAKFVYVNSENEKLYPGIVENLLQQKIQTNIADVISEATDLPMNIRYIKISAKVFSVIIKLFVGFFNGNLIANNQELIKKEDFGKKMFNENISIENVVEEEMFDSEGMKCTNKYLIKNGVMTNCLNNIYSATVLDLEPGECFYDYDLEKKIIKNNNIYFYYDNTNTNDIIEEAYIDGIKNETIAINYDNGDISFILSGKSNDKMIKYNLNCNIINLINSIVGTEGDYLTEGDMHNQNVIIDLSQIKRI